MRKVTKKTNLAPFDLKRYSRPKAAPAVKKKRWYHQFNDPYSIMMMRVNEQQNDTRSR